MNTYSSLMLPFSRGFPISSRGSTNRKGIQLLYIIKFKEALMYTIAGKTRSILAQQSSFPIKFINEAFIRKLALRPLLCPRGVHLYHAF